MGMKPFTLIEIAESCGGKLVCGGGQEQNCIKSVCLDSRKASDGSLFVCIKGERVDGHDYMESAYDSGALCCLCERAPQTDKPYILVSSVSDAIRYVAKAYRDKFDIPFVGVVGSLGKTTAKEMASCVLSEKYNVLKTHENLNNELGVPLTVLSVMEEHTAAVIEMGISDFGEMRRLSEIVRPDIVVFTVIDRCHLEFLGDLDGVMRAKGEVFEYMKDTAVAVMNSDNDILYAYNPPCRKLMYGSRSGSVCSAKEINIRGFDGTDCVISLNGNDFPVHINAFGSYVVTAALSAAVVGDLLSVSADGIARGIEKYRTVGNRAKVIKLPHYTVISDCYNANPTSVKASLATVSAIPSRKVAVLGDMLELGRDSDALHYEIGKYAESVGIDCLVACGKNAENIYKGFISSHPDKSAKYYSKKADLIDDLGRIIEEHDTILVKASHGLHFEDIVEVLEKGEA